jgi:hypothetical protein
MDGRRARLIDRPVLDNLPALTAPAPAPGSPPVPEAAAPPPSAPAAEPARAPEPTRPARRRGGRLTRGWAAALGLGWPLVLAIGIALEPAAAEPEAATPLIAELGSSVLFAALVATVVAATRRHPVAAVAAVVTGLVTAAFSVTCPVSGHHAFWLWWVGQLGVTMAMLGVSVAALGPRSRTAGHAS